MEEEKKELNEELEKEEQGPNQESGDTHAPEEEEKTEEKVGVEEEEEEEYELIPDGYFDTETEPEQPVEKSFTQSQVNELVGNTRKEARDRTLRELLEKYGVNDNTELDGIFGKGQRYDLLNDDYTNQGNELMAVKTENALLKSKIRDDRWEDAKAILKSKGLEVTVDNILAEALTHPEWVAEDTGAKQVGKEELESMSRDYKNTKNKAELNDVLQTRPSTIKRVGSSVESETAPTDEKKRAMSFFGL